MKPTLLVLAAGMGSRYGGLKQIDAVGPNGETIIDYSIYDALRAGFGRLVFVIRKDIEAQFREIVGARFEQRIPVEYVFQELDKLPVGFAVPAGRTKPWGTTHAILMAADAIQEPFAAINADDFYGRQSYSLLAQQLQSGTTNGAMVGFILRNTLSEFGSVARGVCTVDAQDELKSVVELTKIEPDGSGAKNTDAAGHITRLTGDEIVSMNFWGFTPEVFGHLKTQFAEFLKTKGGDLKAECYIPSVVSDLIAAGQMRAKVLRSADSWFGVTYREDRPRVVESVGKLIASGAYPQKLWT
jgi:NDP-sugar pyrophosphorylase family protein